MKSTTRLSDKKLELEIQISSKDLEVVASLKKLVFLCPACLPTKVQGAWLPVSNTVKVSWFQPGQS